jgi:hypothetical protein
VGDVQVREKSLPRHSVTEGIITYVLRQKRAPCITLYGVDHNVTSYRIPAYSSIVYVAIVLVGR